MAELCIKTKMAHYEGGYGCTEFTRFTLEGPKIEKACYGVPKKEVIFEEREFCGNDVREVKDKVEGFKEKVYQSDGWHIKTEQYLKFADGTKGEIREKPFLTCGFLWGAEFCWASSEELKGFLDENSNEYTVHFLGREWVCFAKKKD